MGIRTLALALALTGACASVALTGCATGAASGAGNQQPEEATMQKLRPFLMFEGDAEEAMNFYVSLFPDGKIQDVEYFGAEEQFPDAEGSIKLAVFTIGGLTVRCFDSPAPHPFTFTPAFSLFFDCESAEEQQRLYDALSEGGELLMPLEDYGFSQRFGWVNDRFGVSWQLNLP